MSQRDTTHSVDDDLDALELLELRLQALLPEEYEDTYQSLEATPMRSAPLAYDEAGRVAWDVIWGGFCDLALAGGPPHKGSLLRPGSQVEIEENRDQYHRVTAEICRGITMATNLAAREAATAGWVHVDCPDELTASWLLRAIVVENVAVRHHGTSILLPAAPGFRLEKEIKNVVTVVAKTVHYWTGHMTGLKRWTIARVLADIDAESPLVVPAEVESDSDRVRLRETAPGRWRWRRSPLTPPQGEEQRCVSGLATCQARTDVLPQRSCGVTRVPSCAAPPLWRCSARLEPSRSAQTGRTESVHPVEI